MIDNPTRSKVNLFGRSFLSDFNGSLNLPTVIVQEGGYQLDRLGSDAVTLLREFAET